MTAALSTATMSAVRKRRRLAAPMERGIHPLPPMVFPRRPAARLPRAVILRLQAIIRRGFRGNSCRATTQPLPTGTRCRPRFFLSGKTFWLGSNNTPTTGGNPAAAINMQGGAIIGTGTSNLALTASGSTTSPMLVLNGSNSGNSTGFSLLTAVNGCSITSVIPYTSTPPGCQYSVSTDNLLATGTIVANNLYALNFLYQPSGCAV